MPAPALVTTAGAANANSYLSIADADAIADTMVGTLAWSSATSDNKARALLTATNGMETLRWNGDRATTTQALSWPRKNAACGDKTPDATTVPREVQLAVFDLANALLGNPQLLRNTDAANALIPGVPNRDLARIKLDVMEVEWNTNRSSSTTRPATPLTVLPHLASILGCLCLSSPRTGVGSATTTQRS